MTRGQASAWVSCGWYACGPLVFTGNTIIGTTADKIRILTSNLNPSVVAGDNTVAGTAPMTFEISGEATLEGGAGNDTLNGGSGADVFADGFGNDVVESFQNGLDRFDFAAHTLVSGFADLSISADGANALIADGAGKSIRVLNGAGLIDASDFLF